VEKLTDKKREFESTVMVHLNAAYNLAHWLVKDASGAEDVVQESCLRAFRYFSGFRGGDARPWLLGIVRNAAFTWLRERGVVMQAEPDQDDNAGEVALEDEAQDGPESMLIRKTDAARIDAAIAALPVPYREVIVLRAIEELSYEAIADVAGVPIGTVMSRLSRARAMLRRALVDGSDGKGGEG
jgi:RNA polymerase sigma factor (sigma-70 family)